MCLIIFKPRDRLISTALIHDAYLQNNDGWGLMYSELGEIHIYKGFDLDELVATVLAIQEEREVFLHLRMRTHGAVSDSNLHPFQIVSDVALMHNGILDIHTADQFESDTSAFVRMLQPMLAVNPELIFDAGWLFLVSEFCRGSRLAFLHSSGRYSIVHQKQGIEWQGLWCSNTYAWTLWDELRRQSKAVAVGVSSVGDEELFYDWHLQSGDRVQYHTPNCVKDVEYQQNDDWDLSNWADLKLLKSLDYEELVDLAYLEPELLAQAIYAG